jgi:peptidoglycan/LPS O-acetylase OafA/YrhL
VTAVLKAPDLEWSPTRTVDRRAARSPEGHGRRRSNRLTGLDGLRAVAVVAVVTFHLDSSLLPGGFLGVDVFFALSGYLITRLLLGEYLATGTISLRRFYARRARRLSPAAAVLLIAVTAASLLVWRDELATLPGSALASLVYGSNWWSIFDHQSYFVASGRPPMLTHLWSLAVEEQFYVVWSLLLVGLTSARWWSRSDSPERRIRWAALCALALAVASTAAMTVIAITTKVPFIADSSRVYFGTDTHSMGLFLGSAAGAWAVLRAGRDGRRSRPTVAPWITDLLGGLGLIALVWAFRNLDEYTPGLYRGGFLAVAGVVVVVLAMVTRAGSRLGRMLDIRPLRWLGVRSYSVYLWHWPVFVVTRPGLDVHGPAWIIDPLRIGLVLVLAAASYRFIEVPLRSGQRPQLRIQPCRWLAAVAVGTTCAGALLLSTTDFSAAGGAAVLPTPVPTAPAAATSAPTAGSGRPTPTATSTAVAPPSPRRPPAPFRPAGPPAGDPISLSAYGD